MRATGAARNSIRPSGGTSTLGVELSRRETNVKRAVTSGAPAPAGRDSGDAISTGEGIVRGAHRNSARPASAAATSAVSQIPTLLALEAPVSKYPCARICASPSRSLSDCSNSRTNSGFRRSALQTVRRSSCDKRPTR